MSVTPAGLAPELTVAAVIERDGRYMLVEERILGQLVLNQPAGHVEPGEAPVAAVIREVLEETAWTFAPEAVIGVYLWDPGGGRTPFLRIAFSGQCLAHHPERRLDDGIERVLWLTRAELLTSRARWRSPLVPRAVADHEQGERHPVGQYAGLTLAELALHAVIP
ncbi:MAG: NUDIX hydrolase [Gammaproteobacteria bacterium]